MSGFNPGSNIHVEAKDDEVLVRFEENTLGVNYGKSGFKITNDWNDRHFTLGFDEDSILYHVTREDIDDRMSGKKSVSPEEFASELYGYIRSLAPAVPKDEFGLDFVGRINIKKLRSYLRDRNVIEKSGGDLDVKSENIAILEEKLRSDPASLGELYQECLNPVTYEKAFEESNGEHFFIYPTDEIVFTFVNYPGPYVGVATLRGILNFAEMAGGSQIVDHILRSVGD